MPHNWRKLRLPYSSGSVGPGERISSFFALGSPSTALNHLSRRSLVRRRINSVNRAWPRKTNLRGFTLSTTCRAVALREGGSTLNQSHPQFPLPTLPGFYYSPRFMALALKPENIVQLVFFVRGEKVMVDADLARLYGVSTKALNQAFRRNKQRFPSDFAFQLSSAEYDNLKSQIVTSSAGETNLRS